MPILDRKQLDKLAGADIRHLIAVCRQKCLCCTNHYNKYHKKEEQYCSVGKCYKRTPSTRQIQYIHATLRNVLRHAKHDEIISRNVE